ncbi:MAG: cellulose synthase/poly-beta-1,6-N-acetylglucosamine synthase-like glycosyltransferase [Planctomycetota bacterium]|jgi:cellulose synthase/poly-beta-1,6-N-acetylglucosamine synthase-like glycosyltransferase
MSTLWIVLGIALALVTLPGTIELWVLSMAGALQPRKRPQKAARQLHLAIVVPAHDEEGGIERCVSSLKACDAPQGQVDVFVIADNCSDETAQRAEAAGAQVLVRDEADLRGKGYALDFAFTRLLADERNFDAFLVIDADTTVAPNLVKVFESAFSYGTRAAQCRYTASNPDASLRTRLQNIALLAFNFLRPRGRERLGLSVGIAGNGFGLRRDVLARFPYEARSVVEDLEYHLKLVEGDVRVEFLESTSVLGEMPTGQKAASSQRARWEGGRMRMIREHVPGLAMRVMSGQWRFLEPLFELLLLPLAMHVMLLLTCFAIPFDATRLYALAGLGLVGVHVSIALIVGKAGVRDLLALASAPLYVLWKLTQLPRLVGSARSNAGWVRTEREN